MALRRDRVKRVQERGTKNFADISIDQSSFDNIERLFNELPVEVAKEIRVEANKAAGKVVTAAAKATTAFKDDSGRLRRSIRMTVKGGFVARLNGKRVRIPGNLVQVRAGAAGARQPVLVEMGHGGPKPAPEHPFLQPAAEQSAPAAWSAAQAAARHAFMGLVKGSAPTKK